MSADKIWMLARLTAKGNVSSWYGYWQDKEEAHRYVQSNAEGGDGTPCEDLCNNEAEWFETRAKTVKELRELEYIRVKNRFEELPDGLHEA